MTEAISVAGLGKIYRGAFRKPPMTGIADVSFDVHEGEAFGFIGPNGAGKSTTIKILTGGMLPTSGSARLFGVDVCLPESRRGLGYVPENPSLPDYLTPLEILRMGMSLHGLRTEEPTAHCMNWLERFGLANVAGKVLRQFSKGMAQRTALAHAMVVRPRLLILDEPLSGLDPIGRRDVVDILEEYKAAGGTLLFTSHVLHDVERLADRFGLINHGILQAVQSPHELVSGEPSLTIRSLGAAQVEGFIAEHGGRWRAEVPRDQVWGALERLRTAGHSVIEVKPTLSLEQAFIRAVARR
jgi:ABC-2 type transport system ATP-binding protein